MKPGRRKQVKMTTRLLAGDLGQVRVAPLGIRSLPYVLAKCCHYPLSLNEFFLLPHGSCKICRCRIRPQDQGQTEVDPLACVRSFNLANNTHIPPTTARVRFEHGGNQVHADTRRCKQANALRDSCMSSFGSPAWRSDVAACQHNCFKTRA